MHDSHSLNVLHVMKSWIRCIAMMIRLYCVWYILIICNGRDVYINSNKCELNITVNSSIFHYLLFKAIVTLLIIFILIPTFTMTIKNILYWLIINFINEKPSIGNEKLNFNYENIIYFQIMTYLKQNILF